MSSCRTLNVFCHLMRIILDPFIIQLRRLKDGKAATRSDDSDIFYAVISPVIHKFMHDDVKDVEIVGAEI